MFPEVALPCCSLGSQLVSAWRIGPLMVFVATAARPACCHPLWLLGFVLLLPGACGSALNTAGNSTAPEGGGLGILIDIGIGTSIGIVVLGAVAAIIPLAVLKKNR
ncbi:hypothetical protein KIL84_007799 [Mauremys mutica]|uniref:Uncharacterized protein n=1 Tax=Mauremys mutica TaxID=74926 RepID=A0A9D3X3H6_9SAUR|nr:hypothetical protein KIL84_007799 [Mauremys mutica]